MAFFAISSLLLKPFALGGAAKVFLCLLFFLCGQMPEKIDLATKGEGEKAEGGREMRPWKKEGRPYIA